MFDEIGEQQLETCLGHVKTLKMMFLITNGSEDDGLEHIGTPDDDPHVIRIRFGRSFRADWKEGAYGGMDMWAFGVKVMAERRSLLCKEEERDSESDHDRNSEDRSSRIG